MISRSKFALLILPLFIFLEYSAVAFGASATYIYDDLGRLQSVTYDNGTKIHYNVDEIGNRTSMYYEGGTFPVSAGWSAGGSISPASANVISGGSETFLITPDVGYLVKEVRVDGRPVGSPTTYTLANVTAPHIIEADFEKIKFPITVTVDGGIGGTITPTTTEVYYGDSQTFTITPATGYHISYVVADTASVGKVTSYTFSEVKAPHSLRAGFSNTYVISTSVVGNGTITPPSATVTFGGSQTFTITPGPGASIVNVRADTYSLGTISSYTFSNVDSDHTLVAEFTQENGPVQNSRTNVTYPNLQSAYDAANSGDIIKCKAVQFTENFEANQDKSIYIYGGYNSDFTSNPSMTVLVGNPVISSGKVTWINFRISK